MYKLIKNEEIEYDAILKEEKSIKSLHTGKDLKKYEFESSFKEYADDTSFSEKFRSFLDQSKDIPFQISNDFETGQFLVSNYNYSFKNSSRDDYLTNIYTFTIEVREVEELHLKKLLINDKEYEVLRYSEEVEKNNSIIINTILKLSEEEKDTIISLQRHNQIYFDVISLGIRDYSITMRFGKIYWSKHEDYYKADITLVENKYDEEKNNIYDRMLVEQGNLIAKLSEQIEYNKLLEEILIEKNLLSEKEVIEMNKKAKENYSNNVWQFTLIDDVEK